MVRLGLQLTMHCGREAFVRLFVTAAAVAVGIALLLGVLAEFHAFQANASQPCWSCTQGASVPSALPARGELWNDSVDFYQGQVGAQLLSGLGGINGATAYPLYSQAPPTGSQLKTRPGSGPGDGRKRRARGSAGDTVVSCSVMRGLAVLGQCAPGLAAVQTDTSSLFSDNPSDNTKPVVSASNSAYTGDPAKLPLAAVLVRVDNPTVLERVRTFLAVNAPPQESGGQGQSPTPPRTFGETLQIRLDRAATLEKLVYAAVALTLIVAGCSLAVAVGGGLVDRKRPFTLLRVSGTQIGVLSAVLLLEAAVPLAAATLIAAGIAYGTSMLAFIRLAPAGTAIPQLGHDYYTLMAIGLVAAFAVITVTLPLLNRMTAPNTVRFE